MPRTFLDLTQSILNEMDSEPVSSISDTLEAYQVASVLRDVVLDYLSTQDYPYLQKVMPLEVYSDSDYPTSLKYPKTVKEIKELYYFVDDHWYEINYVEPEIFFSRMPRREAEDVTTFNEFTVFNNRTPTYYTSFDNETIVFNSYNKDVDDTIQAHKVRAYGTHYLKVIIEDNFVLDIPDGDVQYVLAEAKAKCFDLFKGGMTQKQEQTTKRLRASLQDNRFKTKQKNKVNCYGRHR